MLKSEIKVLPVSCLIADTMVQRAHIRQGDVNKIADNLDMDAIGIIFVSRRDNGTYHVIDGLHRVSALRLAGGENEVVTCRVFAGLTLAEEARMFRLLNTSTKPQTIDLFRVRVVEGEPNAVGITGMLEKHGWRVADTAGDGAFSAVASIERIWRQDKTAAEHAVVTLTRAWGHSPMNLDGRILEGVGLLYLRYGSAIDASDLTDRLARFPGGAGALLGKARGLRELLNVTVPRALAEIVVELYNARRKTRALPPWRA